MFLVTGATGTTGSEVVRQLAAAGERLRALVRNSEKARAIEGPGVEIVVGDFERPETLDEALRGVKRVFLLSSLDPRQLEVQGNLIDAARRAGVERIVRMSAFGSDLDSAVSIRRWHGQVDERLERTGVPFTILRPHYFMQNILAFAPSVAGSGAVYAPMGNGRIGLVDTRDIAAVAVRTLIEDGHEGKTYDITGPESLSFGEIAQKLSAATEIEVAYVDVSPEAATQALLEAGLPQWLADALVELYGVFAAGHGDVVTNVVAEVGRKAPRTFGEFAAEHADAFRGA